MNLNGPAFKIAVFTYDRFDTLTTPAALEHAGADYDVVCHTLDAAERFARAGRVVPGRLVVSGEPKGLANNRNWWIEHRLAPGQWALMMVDDLVHVRELSDYESREGTYIAVDLERSGYWHRKFDALSDMKTFLRRAVETAGAAEAAGVSLAGFAGNNNPLFRKHKWRRDVLVDGRAMLVRKTGLRFDPRAQMVDDVCFTAMNIRFLNGSLVNQWVLPQCSRYTRGSYGAISQRLDQRRAECLYLAREYRPIVQLGRKKGWPFGTHVRIASLKKR